MSHARATARTVITGPSSDYDHDGHETLIASLRARGFGRPPHDAPPRGIRPAELYELQAAVVGETLLACELLARAGFSKAGRCFQ